MEKINKCMGDTEADTENKVLKAEQDLQVGHGSRGDITILPTMLINDVQYRGILIQVGRLLLLVSCTNSVNVVLFLEFLRYVTLYKTKYNIHTYRNLYI